MTEKKISLVAVVGPTATGKTALSIALAKKYGGEIVSCDSMQIYKGLPIGTAQPSKEELNAVSHHLIGFLPPEQPFSVSDYVELASDAITKIHNRGSLPILVGGTGLYARSLLQKFTFDDDSRSETLRAKLSEEAEAYGIDALYTRLKALDPASAGEIHPNNVKRVIRALEYCELTGEPFSMQARRSQEIESPYSYVMLCLTYRDREQLYQRINARVDKMMEAGLLEEAKCFFDFCKIRDIQPTAAQAIGYKELFPYFRDEVSLEEAVDDIKRESRRYAKRQITWFKREKNIDFLYCDELGSEAKVLAAAIEEIEKAQIMKGGGFLER